MRRPTEERREERQSALWGTGNRGGDSRPRAWRTLLLALAVVGLALPVGAAGNAASGKPTGAVVDPTLVRAMADRPDGTFDVIVQAARGGSSRGVADAVGAAAQAAPGKAKGLGRVFQSIDGVSAQLTAKQVERLARHPHVAALTLDAPVKSTKYSNVQAWPTATELPKLWTKASRNGLKAPTIAVIDSGIAAERADFGGRVIEQVNLSSSPLNSSGDGRGHGTFVASIASNGLEKITGGAPNAPIVSIDVIDDQGAGVVSDVIAAADWVLANRTRLDIRVVNLSLNAAYPSTFLYDPLDKAVERLWFAGVVVVVSAGNQAVDGQESGIPFSPANDPFVITVGAADIRNNTSLDDDFNAPWSAWGYTLDGFSKPDVGAPGRYMYGATPSDSTLYLERPEHRVANGYMQLSGTSFAAPVVASAAAWILAANPTWGPDQVKGALMLTAQPAGLAPARSLGVGMVLVEKASKVTDPPNPNAGLNRFVVPDPSGSPLPVFDAAAWTSEAQSNPAWNSAAWTSAAWTSAAWTNNATDDATSLEELSPSGEDLYALEVEQDADLDDDGHVGAPPE